MKEHILSPQSCKMANHTCQITREDSIKFWKRPNGCGGSRCCGSPGGQLHMPVPHGCTHRTGTATPEPATTDGQERTSPRGQTYPSHFWVAQPDFTRQEKTLATSHPHVSPLLASLSLVFPYSSSCQRSPSACFFFPVPFVSMQTPYCCRHHCQGLRHPPGALPEQSNATSQAPPGWDCGSCSAPGRRGLQQAEGGQVLHSHPSLPPREIEDRNENLGCLAG